MKVEIEIFTLAEQEPKQYERVMVWHEKFKQWIPQVFNKDYECWDEEYGDDDSRKIQLTDRWFRLPK